MTDDVDVYPRAGIRDTLADQQAKVKEKGSRLRVQIAQRYSPFGPGWLKVARPASVREDLP